jgi:cytochrome P450
VDTRTLCSFEKVEDLRYFINCFYESLRLEPPTVTSGAIFTEPQSILGVNIRKGDLFVINIQQMHHDEREWIEPESFIPERFDHSSKYYLRPDGQRRHPYSFNPFIGGKRICLGKTFAEIVAKFVVPTLLSRWEFDFVDQDLKSGKKPKPRLNIDMEDEPVIMMTIKRANLQAGADGPAK